MGERGPDRIPITMDGFRSLAIARFIVRYEVIPRVKGMEHWHLEEEGLTRVDKLIYVAGYAERYGEFVEQKGQQAISMRAHAVNCAIADGMPQPEFFGGVDNGGGRVILRSACKDIYCVRPSHQVRVHLSAWHNVYRNGRMYGPEAGVQKVRVNHSAEESLRYQEHVDEALRLLRRHCPDVAAYERLCEKFVDGKMADRWPVYPDRLFAWARFYDLPWAVALGSFLVE